MTTSEPPYLYLTTTGRKTGQPHEIEIWFVGYQGRYYLVSERWERSDWVRNIQQDSAVSFRVGTQQLQGFGRLVDRATEVELATAVSALMETKYDWSDGLIVALTPVTS